MPNIWNTAKGIMGNSTQQNLVLYAATHADYAATENMWCYYVYENMRGMYYPQGNKFKILLLIMSWAF